MFAKCDRRLTADGGLRSYSDSQRESGDSHQRVPLSCGYADLLDEFFLVREGAIRPLIEFPS